MTQKQIIKLLKSVKQGDVLTMRLSRRYSLLETNNISDDVIIKVIKVSKKGIHHAGYVHRAVAGFQKNVNVSFSFHTSDARCFTTDISFLVNKVVSIKVNDEEDSNLLNEKAILYFDKEINSLKKELKRLKAGYKNYKSIKNDDDD